MSNTVPPAQYDAARALFRANDKGLIDYNSLIEQVSELIDVPKEKIVEQVFTGYKIDETVLAYVGELHKRYQISMLSNIGEVTFYKIKDSLMPFFDDFVLSYSTGISKPDHRAFLLAAERLRVAPAECVFIDDDPSNCDAAVVVGMQGVTFTDTVGLRKELSFLLADANEETPLGTD